MPIIPSERTYMIFASAFHCTYLRAESTMSEVPLDAFKKAVSAPSPEKRQQAGKVSSYWQRRRRCGVKS